MAPKYFKIEKMIRLEYFNGKEWVPVGYWHNEATAWVSLGRDNLNYRTVDHAGKVLTDKSRKIEPKKTKKGFRRNGSLLLL